VSLSDFPDFGHTPVPPSRRGAAEPELGPARVALAARDQTLVAQLVSLLVEGGRYDLAGTAGTLSELVALTREEQVDVILLHEDLGPLNVFDNLRALVAQAPAVATVLLVREDTPQVYRSALRGGARGLLQLPPTVDDVQSALDGALEWARAMSSGPARPRGSDPQNGRLLTVAGAKGGVGTSTIAAHLAHALVEGRRMRVCLVDFDLQAGDIAHLLGLTRRRSVVDLLAVTDETDRRPLEEGLSAHESGLQVLLAPEEGEQAERVDTAASRRILGMLRSLFDVVVVDAGAVVTEAGAVAAEVADLILVVVTPDAPAMRGAHRLTALWERLHVRNANVRVLVNRASRRAEVQGELVGKVTRLPVLRTQIPAGFWELEQGLNGGTLGGGKPGAVRTAIGRLRDELGLSVPRRRGRLRGDAGVLTAELVAGFWLFTFVVLTLLQGLVMGLTLLMGEHAAREGAREYGRGASMETVQEAVEADLVGIWARSGASVEEVDGGLAVTLGVPTLVPWPESLRTLTVQVGARRDADWFPGGFL